MEATRLEQMQLHAEELERAAARVTAAVGAVSHMDEDDLVDTLHALAEATLDAQEHLGQLARYQVGALDVLTGIRAPA